VKDFVKEKHFANQNIQKKTRKKAKKKEVEKSLITLDTRPFSLEKTRN
jgi:hypothetical protein